MKKTLKNILVITYFSYKDGLIQTYTLPYVYQMAQSIRPEGKIFLFTLEKPHLRVDPDQVNEIKKKFLEKNIHWLPYEYHPWGLKAMTSWIYLFFKLFVLIWKEKITHIHGWATPGGAAGYILSVLTGKPLVIDSYEPHAEAMVENGSWRKGSLAHRLLFFLERLQTKRASHLIAANSKMGDYARSRYGKFNAPLYEKPACVDLELFSFANKKNEALMNELDLKNKLVCVYAGKFGGIYLDQEAFDFFKTAHDHWGDRFRVLVLTNHSDEELMAFCAKSDLDYNIITKRFVMHKDVPMYLGLGDFGITPVKSVYTKQFCTPIKDGEYWALGLPVVITKNISSDSDIIEQEKIGYVLKDLTSEEYKKAVLEMDRILTGEDISARIRKVAERERNFTNSAKIYAKIYG